MVTRILFDPRRDLPDGSNLASTSVTVQATPTGVREDGSVFIVPSTLSFTVNTAADIVELPAPTASYAWRLTVIDPTSGAILQQRTVTFADVASIPWADLTDVDPSSLGDTVGHARQWDATFANIITILGQITTAGDAVEEWQPNTAYLQSTLVLNPAGQIVQANTSFTSGSTYSASNWTILSLTLATVQSLIASQATSDAGTFVTLQTPPSTYTWNPDGTIATETVAGVTTTYAWNSDGSLHTETRAGVTRTYAYNGDGTLASVA